MSDESPPELPPFAPGRFPSWLSRKTGWANHETRIRMISVSVAALLFSFVIFTIERAPSQDAEAVATLVKEQLTDEVGHEVERMVIEAASLGNDLVSSAQYVQRNSGQSVIILSLKIHNIPDNCMEKPLMVYLVRTDRTVVTAWRPEILLTYSMVRLQTEKLPPGRYDVDVQACGGSFPPSEGRTILRIP